MELEIHRHERVMAPVQLVWEEIDSLEQILVKSPHISKYTISPEGQKAHGTSRLAWGPVKWTVAVDVTIIDLRPCRCLSFTIDVPALGFRSQASVDLMAIGEAETMLDYRGHLAVRHPIASRMRGLLNEVAEEQANRLTHHVKVKSEQRRLAQERLLT